MLEFAYSSVVMSFLEAESPLCASEDTILDVSKTKQCAQLCLQRLLSICTLPFSRNKLKLCLVMLWKKKNPLI